MQGKEKESRCPGSKGRRSSTEKDATDNEFEDGPTPASNNLKDHWPKIIYCNFILFLANNPKQLKNDEIYPEHGTVCRHFNMIKMLQQRQQQLQRLQPNQQPQDCWQ